MRELKKQERTAIEAVAKRFRATWEKGSDPPDAYLTVDGKRAAVDIATLKRHGRGEGNAAKPHLRFDKVATRLIKRLRASFDEIVPDGRTVLLTITAPIRLPSKTADSLEDKIRILLSRRSPDRDEKGIIHGNAVRLRLVRTESGAPKMIGFVHNSDSDPRLLMDMTTELLGLIGARAGQRRGINMPTEFAKILTVFGDGSVGVLSESASRT